MRDTTNMRVQTNRPRLTATVDLPGRQDRLRQLILYVSLRCEKAPRFGKIKLNKIIWKADFNSFAKRKMPVTGRAYQKIELGPAPKEMKPLLDEMEHIGLIDYQNTDFGDDIVEMRPIAKVPPNLAYFSKDDLSFVEEAIFYYWEKTGMETSDGSHGIAWKSRRLNETMHYELSYLSDERISQQERTSILAKLQTRSIIDQSSDQ
jgi:hypothetical protein